MSAVSGEPPPAPGPRPTATDLSPQHSTLDLIRRSPDVLRKLFSAAATRRATFPGGIGSHPVGLNATPVVLRVNHDKNQESSAQRDSARESTVTCVNDEADVTVSELSNELAVSSLVAPLDAHDIKTAHITACKDQEDGLQGKQNGVEPEGASQTATAQEVVDSCRDFMAYDPTINTHWSREDIDDRFTSWRNDLRLFLFGRRSGTEPNALVPSEPAERDASAMQAKVDAIQSAPSIFENVETRSWTTFFNQLLHGASAYKDEDSVSSKMSLSESTYVESQFTDCATSETSNSTADEALSIKADTTLSADRSGTIDGSTVDVLTEFSDETTASICSPEQRPATVHTDAGVEKVLEGASQAVGEDARPLYFEEKDHMPSDHPLADLPWFTFVQAAGLVSNKSGSAPSNSFDAWYREAAKLIQGRAAKPDSVIISEQAASVLHQNRWKEDEIIFKWGSIDDVAESDNEDTTSECDSESRSDNDTPVNHPVADRPCFTYLSTEDLVSDRSVSSTSNKSNASHLVVPNLVEDNTALTGTISENVVSEPRNRASSVVRRDRWSEDETLFKWASTDDFPDADDSGSSTYDDDSTPRDCAVSDSRPIAPTLNEVEECNQDAEFTEPESSKSTVTENAEIIRPIRSSVVALLSSAIAASLASVRPSRKVHQLSDEFDYPTSWGDSRNTDPLIQTVADVTPAPQEIETAQVFASPVPMDEHVDAAPNCASSVSVQPAEALPTDVVALEPVLLTGDDDVESNTAVPTEPSEANTVEHVADIEETSSAVVSLDSSSLPAPSLAASGSSTTADCTVENYKPTTRPRPPSKIARAPAVSPPSSIGSVLFAYGIRTTLSLASTPLSIVNSTAGLAAGVSRRFTLSWEPAPVSDTMVFKARDLAFSTVAKTASVATNLLMKSLTIAGAADFAIQAVPAVARTFVTHALSVDLFPHDLDEWRTSNSLLARTFREFAAARLPRFDGPQMASIEGLREYRVILPRSLSSVASSSSSPLTIESKALSGTINPSKKSLAPLPPQPPPPGIPSLSFSFYAGNGIGPKAVDELKYAVGAAISIRDNFTADARTGFRYLGSGLGAVLAALIAFTPTSRMYELEDIFAELVQRIEEVACGRERFVGALGAVSGIVYKILNDNLPYDVFGSYFEGKVSVSVTTFPTFKSLVVDRFRSRLDLIEVIQASCFLPFTHQHPVVRDSTVLISGTLSNPLPRIDERTITISAVPGDANISPWTPACSTTIRNSGFAAPVSSPPTVIRNRRPSLKGQTLQTSDVDSDVPAAIKRDGMTLDVTFNAETMKLGTAVAHGFVDGRTWIRSMAAEGIIVKNAIANCRS